MASPKKHLWVSPQAARWRREVFEEEGDLEDAGTLLNKEAMYDRMVKEIEEMDEEERVSAFPPPAPPNPSNPKPPNLPLRHQTLDNRAVASRLRTH